MTTADDIARIGRALSVPTRVKLIELLKSRSLCVNALARRLKVTQGAVSQHLRVLRDCDLVCAKRKGAFVHYRLNEKTVAKWRALTERMLQLPED